VSAFRLKARRIAGNPAKMRARERRKSHVIAVILPAQSEAQSATN
jgi:hypothetical protein